MFFFFRKNLVWTDKPKLQFIRGFILLFNFGNFFG
jgi:hypothetical protein